MTQQNPIKYYKNNAGLKSANQKIAFTPDQIEECMKCAKDPAYFIENYVMVVSLDEGPILFKMFPYQKRFIDAIHNNTRIIAKIGRQLGKSSILAAYTAWFVLFNEFKTAAILANKLDIAKEIFGRVQFIIENLPTWLQQGIVEWNKTSFELENGSVCFAAATSPSAIRGKSISLLTLDEFSHLKPNLAEEFIKSVFPTISSSMNSKMAIISTPNGLNHFYKLWNDSENSRNDFIRVEGHWSENPYRSQEWADQQLKELGQVGFEQEVCCSFIGSSYTLIDGHKIASLGIASPIYNDNNLEIFEEPKKNHSYIISVDTSRGRGLDYSAFSIIDVTKLPYQVVGCYKDNLISTMEYPHLIYNYARQYNDAYILVEVNDIGEEVSNILWYDYEYENLYFTNKDGLTSSRGYPGVRTTSKVKTLGCSVLKDLIEKDQLIVNSFRIIEELGVFVLQRKSYGADDTVINDDLTTTLWLFAWLSKQEEFQEATYINIRSVLSQKKQEFIDSMMTPFGFYNDGHDEEVEDSSKLPPEGSYDLTESQMGLLS